MNIYRNIELQKENQTLVLSVVRSARKQSAPGVRKWRCSASDSESIIGRCVTEVSGQRTCMDLEKSKADADANGTAAGDRCCSGGELSVMNWKK